MFKTTSFDTFNFVLKKSCFVCNFGMGDGSNYHNTQERCLLLPWRTFQLEEWIKMVLQFKMLCRYGYKQENKRGTFTSGKYLHTFNIMIIFRWNRFREALIMLTVDCFIGCSFWFCWIVLQYNERCFQYFVIRKTGWTALLLIQMEIGWTKY